MAHPNDPGRSKVLVKDMMEEPPQWRTLLLQRSQCEERRTDVMRAVLNGPAEPGFWPSRGRRGDSGEEQPPPFWAHRGRDLCPPCGYDLQQPKYLVLQSREETPGAFWPSRGRKRSPDH